MKLKINKACDLSSISVLPPQARRSNTVPPAPPASQFRLQQSQQSFSQSQHGMSQFSQNSIDEAVTNDQRFCSQERENSSRRISCLAPTNYQREESQMPISRTSNNMIRKWGSAPVSDHGCQISEELERRIGMMETSLSRFGRILDSVQSDVMQVNKGTKELSMEMEGVRQKLIVYDNSLQLMNKGQEDIKVSFNGGVKAITDQLSKDTSQDKLQETFSVLSAIPEQIESCLLKLKNDLSNTFMAELQTMVSSLKSPSQSPTFTILPPLKRLEPAKNQYLPSNVCVQAPLVPKIEAGSWRSARKEQATLKGKGFNKEYKQQGVSSTEQEREWGVSIDSDEEMNAGFSCLLGENETDIGNYLVKEAKEETEQILRRARRRKRKHDRTISLN